MEIIIHTYHGHDSGEQEVCVIHLPFNTGEISMPSRAEVTLRGRVVEKGNPIIHRSIVGENGSGHGDLRLRQATLM